MTEILRIKKFSLYDGVESLLKEISFSMNEGEILGIFGKSGSGKSLICKSIMNLQNHNLFKSGEIWFKNMDLNNYKNLRKFRGKNLSIMFQNISKSLNPMLTLRKHIEQVSKCNTNELLQDIGFQNSYEILNKYPHQLSGGELSRFGLALALAPSPDLLILDEAFTSIDDNLKTKFISLIKNLVQQNKTSILLVTHDLEIMHKLSDRFIVLENGEIIETGDDFFGNPTSNYLINSISSYKGLYNYNSG